MPFEMGWYIKNEIVYMNLIGDVTEEEFNAGVDKLNQWTEEVGKTLDIIADNRQLESYSRLASLVNVETPDEPGWLIIIGLDHPVMRFIVSAASQILRLKLKRVADETEAIAVLKRVLPQHADQYHTPFADYVTWEHGETITDA
ncbi:MAG: hypothetical protein AAF126_17075 [Chloroflexota bacterium]